MSDLALYILSPFLTIALGLLVVRLWTTWAYYSALRQFDDSARSGQKIVRSPQIPYWLPFLGNTTSFLTTRPGSYWNWIFSWHPRSTGVFTLLIGGRKTHILYSPTAVQALFKARTPARDVFERELFGKVFEMPPEQIHNAEEGKHFEVEMNSQYLTNHTRVNELTTHFTKVLDQVLSKDANEVVQLDHVGLYAWLRDRMFTASVTALMGEKLLEMYPKFGDDFFGFDYDFLSFFFGLPNFVMGDAIERKKRIMDKLEEWSAAMHRLSGGSPVDPEGPAWEPYFGSRLNRARQIDYKNRRLNSRSACALDLGMTFGLSSNAIPATGWMLMNILRPHADPQILDRVLAEIQDSLKEDGSLDVSVLMQQPLLQSIWTETLRLYVDVLVTRNLPEDILIPLDEDKKYQVLFKKGDNLFAPAFIPHFDPNSWTSDSVSPDVFYADRFIVRDPKTGRDTFSMGRTTGKFFPFGGGKTICPGRHFAKQESIGALAMVLLRFEFTVQGFVDTDNKPTQKFPGPGKTFPGSGALTPGGDMMVKMKRRG